jgi:hypothetical protein
VNHENNGAPGNAVNADPAPMDNAASSTRPPPHYAARETAYEESFSFNIWMLFTGLGSTPRKMAK